MLDPEMKQRRLALLEKHFKSEVNKEFDVTLDTFAEQAHYEIMPTGEVYDTDDAVRAYHVRNRTAFPDQRHENVRYHFSDDDTVTAEFDLLGTNLGEFFGLPPTGKSYRIPVIPVRAGQVRVNAISPGYIPTPGYVTNLGFTQAQVDQLATSAPMGRGGTPDEVARAVTFLASEDASYITGIELFVDGGVAQI